MAIILPSGFNITNNEPVDARLTLVDETAKYALSSANVYEGLIVFQQDNDTIWVLTDTANVGNLNGWTQIQIGSVGSNLPSGIISGSSQINIYDTDGFDNFNDSILTDLAGKEEVASTTHTLISGSSQLTQSLNNHYVTLLGDQIIGSTKTFNNIIITGTGSFNFIQSTTGSSTSIGEAFIVLNENTPHSNFAGIKVIDSGSIFTTASFLYNGSGNNWVYQHNGSMSSGSSLAIFGPLSHGGLGTEVGLTENRIPKGVTDHGIHIGDSNISDNGTLITLNSNSQVNGNLVVTGTISATNIISGSSQVSYPELSNIPAGIVSGSSQVTKTLQEVTTAGASTSTAITITNATASTSKTSGALVVTGGIGTSGDIFVGGDVVAYASSDIRLKNNLELISNPLQKINQIGGYSFEWNNEKQDTYSGKDYGVIAQEIEQILPELVNTREDGYKAVKYDKLISLLIEGIKDLSTQVQNLQEKINRG